MSDTEQHDETTGEVIDGMAREQPTEQPVERAASGEVLPAPTASAGAFVDMLEDGEFSREVHENLRELAREMRSVGEHVGKSKGKLKVTFDLSYEDGQFKIGAKYDVTRPELPRPRSVAWLNHDDNFTRFPPHQSQLFGTRSVRAVGGR